jgi:hypothetical protein
MRNTIAARICAVAGLALVLTGAPASVAGAHTDVPVGPLDLEIGFGTEPAFTGQLNSAQLIVTRGGAPVTRGVKVDVEISFGDTTVTLEFEPTEEPGDYRAWFIPSQPGEYTFHVRGRIEGIRVNETVTSGPSTFAEVQDPAPATFPPVEAPSNDELAKRIVADAEHTRAELRRVRETAEGARASASSARTLAVTGLALGVVALVFGIRNQAAIGRRRP